MTYPTDDLGHPQVDFVWGNLPMQPNDERGMAQLDPALDNHVIADTGWANYPQFIPNYDGTTATGGPDSVADAGLEVIVPDLIGRTQTAAESALTKLGLVVGTVTSVTEGATAKNNGKVADQATAEGTIVNIGDSVDFGVYSD